MNIVPEVRKFLAQLGAMMEQECKSTEVGSGPPEELHLELTYKCNSNCSICNIKSLRDNQKGEDLSFEEIRQTVEKSELLKDLNYIVLSGGEPWLHPELLEIVRFFHDRYPKAKMLLLSNLMDKDMVASNLSEIKSAVGLERISIGTSLDGVEKAHDIMRGVEGAFDSLVTTVLMIKKKFPEMYPYFNFTLTPDNSSQIFPVYEWSKKIGGSVSYQVMVQKKETKVYRWNEMLCVNVDTSINKIIQDIWREKQWNEFSPDQVFSNLDILFFLLNFHYMSTYIRSPRRFFPTCPCGEKYAMINPQGDLYFCPVHKDFTAGNIRKDDLDNLWVDRPTAEIRRFINMKTCYCWLSCTNSSMLEAAFFPNKDKIIDKFTKE
ncbi:radical SAM/SPASM domain-containing protein [Elusimicrobiota bacterium]